MHDLTKLGLDCSLNISKQMIHIMYDNFFAVFFVFEYDIFELACAACYLSIALLDKVFGMFVESL